LVVAILVGLLFQAERRPEHDVASGKTELPRHDADDGERLVVDEHVLTDDGDVAAELALPEAITQNERARCAVAIVRLRKEATDERPYAERGKQIPGHHRGVGSPPPIRLTALKPK
jgi:hypothetical protein